MILAISVTNGLECGMSTALSERTWIAVGPGYGRSSKASSKLRARDWIWSEGSTWRARKMS